MKISSSFLLALSQEEAEALSLALQVAVKSDDRSSLSLVKTKKGIEITASAEDVPSFRAQVQILGQLLAAHEKISRVK